MEALTVIIQFCKDFEKDGIRLYEEVYSDFVLSLRINPVFLS